MLLHLLRPMVRLILRVFFRKIDVRGDDRVPAGRPLILVVNHPNVMLDALILGVYAPGSRFLGKSTLFKRPLYTWFLRQIGVIPVARAQDEGSEMSRNRGMLRVACETLREGRSLVVFPEGASHGEMRVRDLKPGVVRIALRAEAEAEGRVCIVPVGLTYSDPGVFRSEAAVHFGEAIEGRPFLRADRRHRHAAEQELTGLIHERLSALTRHIEASDLETLVRDLCLLYAEKVAVELSDSLELSQRLRAEQEIIRAGRHFAGTDPALVRSFARRLRAHRRKLRRLGLASDAVTPPRPARLLLALLLSPLALYGFVHNAVPYYLPRLFVRPYRTEPEMIGTVKMVAGIIVFPVFYLMVAGAACLVTGFRSALLYGVTLPVSGLFTLLYDEHLLRGWPLWKGLISPRGLRRLSEERAALVQDLDALKERYLASLV